MQLRFEYDKETKNAIKYLEDSDLPILGQIYVQKHFFDDNAIKYLDTLLITIDVEE